MAELLDARVAATAFDAVLNLGLDGLAAPLCEARHPTAVIETDGKGIADAPVRLGRRRRWPGVGWRRRRPGVGRRRRRPGAGRRRRRPATEASLCSTPVALPGNPPVRHARIVASIDVARRLHEAGERAVGVAGQGVPGERLPHTRSRANAGAPTRSLVGAVDNAVAPASAITGTELVVVDAGDLQRASAAVRCIIGAVARFLEMGGGTKAKLRVTIAIATIAMARLFWAHFDHGIRTVPTTVTRA